MPPREALSLAHARTALTAMHGRPAPPVATDVFEAAIWECAAYLVDDTRRAATFERLRREVGLTPEALLSAPSKKLLAAIGDGGMLPSHRAEKIRAAARVAVEAGLDVLRRQVHDAPAKARKTLKKFPGIADPGADKLLLLSRAGRSLAPDSNALRVLLRLGYGEEAKDYGRSYRSVAAAVADELPEEYDALIELHQLLRLHGQVTCTRRAPDCARCSMASMCRHYDANRHP